MDEVSDEIASTQRSTHTSAHMSTQIQVVGRVSGRRRWSIEEKLTILRDAFGPGGSVRVACERHEVSSGQLYTWRGQALSGELGSSKAPAMAGFSEVDLADVERGVPVTGASKGPIWIELPTGVKLTVDASVDAAALARVLSVLPR